MPRWSRPSWPHGTRRCCRLQDGEGGDQLVGRAIEQAKAVGDRAALCLAYDVLDWAKSSVGESNGGAYYRLALEIAEETGDLYAQATLLNGLGVRRVLRRPMDRGPGVQPARADLYVAIGDVPSSRVSAMNIAEIFCERGNLEEAESMLRRLAAGVAGVRLPILHRRLPEVPGTPRTRAMRFDEALGMFDTALELFADVGAEEGRCRGDGPKAECQVFMGHAKGAGLVDEPGPGRWPAMPAGRRFRSCSVPAHTPWPRWASSMRPRARSARASWPLDLVVKTWMWP